jgi:hypothetical protein
LLNNNNFRGQVNRYEILMRDNWCSRNVLQKYFYWSAQWGIAKTNVSQQSTSKHYCKYSLKIFLIGTWGIFLSVRNVKIDVTNCLISDLISHISLDQLLYAFYRDYIKKVAIKAICVKTHCRHSIFNEYSLTFVISVVVRIKSRSSLSKFLFVTTICIDNFSLDFYS